MKQWKALQPTLRGQFSSAVADNRRADRHDEFCKQRVDMRKLLNRGKLDATIDAGQPYRRVPFAVDAKDDVGMRISKAGESGGQPKLHEVGGGSDMNFLPALKVQLAGDNAEFDERALKMRQRRAKFGRWTQARAAANDKFDAQKVLERLDALPHSSGGQAQQLAGPPERPRSNRELKCLKRLQM